MRVSRILKSRTDIASLFCTQVTDLQGRKRDPVDLEMVSVVSKWGSKLLLFVTLLVLVAGADEMQQLKQAAQMGNVEGVREAIRS